VLAAGTAAGWQGSAAGTALSVSSPNALLGQWTATMTGLKFGSASLARLKSASRSPMASIQQP
jgi:hypothetical protein